MENTHSNSRLKRILLWGLGISATATAGFFGWNWWRNKNSSVDDLDTQDWSSGGSSASSGSSSPKGISSGASSIAKSDFPLSKGSKGDKVERLQAALIKKYGRSILPKYGADGDFGTETINALKSKGYPTSVSSSLYQQIIGSSSSTTSRDTFDAQTLGVGLFNAANSSNFSKAVELLGKISSPSQYSQVSEVFKQYRIGGGVRKTLVTGMLDTFPNAIQKEVIRQHFLRMGLLYSGGKWSLPSLSGLDFKRIKTLVPTTLYDFKHQVKIKVPEGMIIGYFISEKQGATLFRTLEKNKKLIVSSTDIQII